MGNGSNANFLQKDLCPHACIHCQPKPLPETPVHSQASLFWGHCSPLLVPGAHKVFFVLSKTLFPQSHGSSVLKSHWPLKSNSLRILNSFADPQVENLLWVIELS